MVSSGFSFRGLAIILAVELGLAAFVNWIGQGWVVFGSLSLLLFLAVWLYDNFFSGSARPHNWRLRMSPIVWTALGGICAIIAVMSLFQAYAMYRDGWPLKIQFGSFLNALYYPPISGFEVWGVEGAAINVSGNEVKLESAYLVSGKRGQRIPITFADEAGNYLDPATFNPMPQDAVAYFRALFNTDKAHISEKDFWEKWGPMTVVLRYGDREYKRTFSIKEIEQQFAERRPPPSPPRMTPKASETPSE